MTGNKDRLDDFHAFHGGKVTFGGGEGRITGKGTIHTECLVLSKDFKLPDDSVVVLKVPRKHNLYTINLNDLSPTGKQHKSSYKAIHAESSISEPFQLLHMDLFGPTLIRSIDHKYYCLMIELCGTKGIRREYSNPRSPQQNETEAVRTACYVLNRVSITNPHNKIPYALLTGKIPAVNHFKPFGCHVTILNTNDHLGKFDGKADEGYLIGYSTSTQGNTTTSAGTQDAGSDSDCDEQVIIIPSYPSHSIQGTQPIDTPGVEDVLPSCIPVSTGLVPVPTGSLPIATGSVPVLAGDTTVPTNDVPVHTSNTIDSMFDDKPTTRFPCPSDLGNHNPLLGIFSSSSYDDEFDTALNNINSFVQVSPVPTKRIHTIHPQSLIIGDPTSVVQTRNMVKQNPTGSIDKTMFLKKTNREIILVQVYVDGIIFGSTKKELCDEFEALMKGEFQMSAMGELTFFLGLQVQQRPDGIFIHQEKYVQDILHKFDLGNVRTATTPYEALKLKSKSKSDSPINVHLYRSMIVKKIFKYLKGQPKLGLWYPKESPLVLEAYSDSDYVGANSDRKSTIGGCQFLGMRLISWQRKKQTIVATSSTKAEYVAAANCCGQFWLTATLRSPELGPPAILATIDNTPYTITDDLVRSRLQLANDGGVTDLPIP
nr:putative ribonuclease H-like domain-containing protein [Tanacetum cinerariifolium]